MILFAQLSEDKLKERFTVSALSMANKIKQNTMNEQGIKRKKIDCFVVIEAWLLTINYAKYNMKRRNKTYNSNEIETKEGEVTEINQRICRK